MNKCNCYIYPMPSDKNRNDFIDLLAKEAYSGREKIIEFLNENNQFVFENIEKDKAIAIINEFEKINVVGSLGPLNRYHQKTFKNFKHGFVPTWNWTAAIFSWVWLLFNGLWHKFAFYFMIFFILENVLQKVLFGLFISPSFFSNLKIFGSIIYFGMFENYDYYLKNVKGESFWPMLPYRKNCLPFWIFFSIFICTALIYPLTALESYAANYESNRVISFKQDNFIFEEFPENWTVYENPPSSFFLTLSRATSSNITQTISCCKGLEPQLIGWIQKPLSISNYDDKHTEGMGLFGLSVISSGLFQKFDSVLEESNEKIASSLVGADEAPDWMARWFPKPILEIHYEEFAGREWGKATTVHRMKMVNEESIFYMAVYWTVANDKAIFFLSIPFSPYKDEVDREVKEFLESLAIREGG